VPPDGHYFLENNWRETIAFGPRVGKIAPFLKGFSEPARAATRWESDPSGYLRSCRSRFYSVSSGDSASSPCSPGEKTVPFCATGMASSSRHPLSCRERVRLCNVDRHLLTSLSPLILLSSADTPGGRLIRRGIRLP
jgi:hypothetical protein